MSLADRDGDDEFDIRLMRLERRLDFLFEIVQTQQKALEALNSRIKALDEFLQYVFSDDEDEADGNIDASGRIQ